MSDTPILTSDAHGVVAYKLAYRKITGSTVAAIMLSQLVYWWPRKSGGAIYKTIAEMEEETGLSRKEQDTAIRRLKELGFLSIVLKKVNGAPTRHFILHVDAVEEALSKLPPPGKTGQNHLTESDNSWICPNGANGSDRMGQNHKHRLHTETTTENNILSSAQADDRSLQKDSLPVSEAFEAWDAIAGGAGLPKVRVVTPQRRQRMRTRLNEMKAIKELDPLAIWQAALRQLIRSPHHMGENERGWRANIDFMLQAGRWQQFFEPIADALLKQAQQQAQTVPADTEDVRRARKLAEELKRELGLR